MSVLGRNTSCDSRFGSCNTSGLEIQENLNDSNIDGSFTMANSNVFESLRNSLDSPRKQIFMDIFGNFSYFVMKCMFV